MLNNCCLIDPFIFYLNSCVWLINKGTNILLFALGMAAASHAFWRGYSEQPRPRKLKIGIASMLIFLRRGNAQKNNKASVLIS